MPIRHSYPQLQMPLPKWKRLLLKGTGAFLLLLLSFITIDFFAPFRPAVEYGPIVRYRDGTPMYAFLTRDQQWRMETKLGEITPELKTVIIAKEDKYFYYHPGVNLLAALRALSGNIVHRKRISGASTITMQVARMLEPRKRNYGSKLLEMFHALQLEWHYSKSEILQLYLNLVPYGSNIQGVKAASLLYFNKFPDQLSLAEVTALSVIPNRPNSLVIGKNNDKIITARNKWLNRKEIRKLFAPSVLQDALDEPLNATRLSAPQSAPQLAWRIRRSFPGNNDIRSTIDPSSQEKSTAIIENYSHAMAAMGIYNAAAVVVDNHTRNVVAYIGSPDFADAMHSGQVDGVQAVRSPGSALKPLVYGLAFDKGVVTPKRILTDIPVDFEGYAPENYDEKFRGNVSVEYSLQQSLNIPAVKTLSQVGVPTFVNTLQEAGFHTVWDKRKKLGLSMILGGCGVRLDEMAGLYAAFANTGRYEPLHIVSDSNNRHTTQILTPAATYMVTQILKNLQRPDMPNENVNASNIPHIAWKTGTSYGRRDAWSIGYDSRYTIAVWVGNFSGEGHPQLNGAGIATPLLFQLFNALDPRGNIEIAAPKNIQFRSVCALTGKVPNDFCSQLVIDAYIPGISDNSLCDHLTNVYLSADGKYSYCTSCLPPNGYQIKQYPNISPELAAFYDTNHIPYQKIPKHNPNCSRFSPGGAPIIQSLTDGATYLITEKGQQKLALSCAAGNDVQKVYWYVNDQFVGGCDKTQKLFFIPKDTNIKISCTDDKGRNKDIQIKLKYV